MDRIVHRAVSLILCCGMVISAAVTVTIDHTVKYQTMVGMGGSAATASSFTSDLMNDCGVSCLRIDVCEFTGNTAAATKAYWDAATTKPAIIGSCWSPPGHMKDNGSTNNGGHLKPSEHSAFGDFLIQKLKAFKSLYGVEMYGVGPQNEPSFATFYASCVYDGADLTEVTKVLGQKIKAAGLKTKIYMPDEVYDAWGAKFLAPLTSDAEAKTYVSALAFHGNGANFTAPKLGGMYALAKNNGWELWQTENADNTDGGSNAQSLGSMHHIIGTMKCLRWGKVSVYMKYDIVSGHNSEEFYISAGQKTPTYHLSKGISKFIRPGSVQLRSTASDTVALPYFVVFYDQAASACIFTAATSTAQSVTLKGTNLPATFEKWVATSSGCTNQGNVQSSETVDLPANSVVTLFGKGYTLPPTGTRTGVSPHVPLSYGAAKGQCYDLRGQMVRNVRGNGHVGAHMGNRSVVVFR